MVTAAILAAAGACASFGSDEAPVPSIDENEGGEAGDVGASDAKADADARPVCDPKRAPSARS